jgi:V/A-type H+-transporting ATPase subunit D
MSGAVIRSIRPTRIELLKIKKQLLLARRGHDLLEEKLDALLLEFLRNIEVYRKEKAGVRESLSRAVRYLDDTTMVMGSRTVEEIALCTPEMPDIPMDSRVIMGVGVPRIEVSEAAAGGKMSGYSYLGTTTRLDETVAAFQSVTAELLRLAEREGTVRKLAEEIKVTRRRVNALEHILIPRLEATRQYIEMHLEEREREDLFRRKRTKQLLMEH